jgi:hypothetical protein
MTIIETDHEKFLDVYRFNSDLRHILQILTILLSFGFQPLRSRARSICREQEWTHRSKTVTTIQR